MLLLEEAALVFLEDVLRCDDILNKMADERKKMQKFWCISVSLKRGLSF